MTGCYDRDYYHVLVENLFHGFSRVMIRPAGRILEGTSSIRGSSPVGQEVLESHGSSGVGSGGLSRLYRNSGLRCRVKYGNRGIWFGPRVLPVS